MSEFAKKPQVVILAAGENSRFFPLNTNFHKAGITLLGKPLIVRTLENLGQNGFKDVILVVAEKDYGGRGLSEFLSKFKFQLNITYVLQPQPLGMGDALLHAQSQIKQNFGVIFPSSLNAGSVLLKLIQLAGDGSAISVSPTKMPWLYGIVTLDGQKVTSIVEKPAKGSEPSDLKAQGVYYFTHGFLNFLQKEGPSEYSFELTLNNFAKKNQVMAVKLDQVLPTLKYPWHLLEIQKDLFNTLTNFISPKADMAKTAVIDSTAGPVYIESGAKIGHCARIVGPSYIGQDVYIGDFSLIRQSSFEAGARVGAHSEIARSIFLAGASLHSGFVGDSIIGENVQIGAGFITSNKRLDRANVQVKVKDQLVDTEMTALGTVIGPGAKLGVGIRTMPGKFIGSQTELYPSVTVFEHIPNSAKVKIKHLIEII